MYEFDPKLGIYSFHYESFWQSTAFKSFMFLTGGLFLTFLGFIIYKLIIRKIYSSRKFTPDEWAISQISRLDLESLETREDFKKFYFSITYIIKGYLKKRFGWDFEHKTDEEVISLISNTHLKENLKNNLKEFFSGAQIIKFANEDTLLKQAKSDLERAIHFIKSTKEVSENKK